MFDIEFNVSEQENCCALFCARPTQTQTTLCQYFVMVQSHVPHFMSILCDWYVRQTCFRVCTERVCDFVCVCIHVCLCVCMYVCTCVSVYTYVCMYVYMYIYTYTYIYIYIYMYVCILHTRAQTC
jgi:hypothetical protein